MIIQVHRQEGRESHLQQTGIGRQEGRESSRQYIATCGHRYIERRAESLTGVGIKEGRKSTWLLTGVL